LLVVAVVLVVAILIAVFTKGDAGDGASDAASEEVQSEGLVIEDTATVQVDIPDETTSEAAAEE
jgi:hypothetical protein